MTLLIAGVYACNRAKDCKWIGATASEYILHCEMVHDCEPDPEDFGWGADVAYAEGLRREL